MIFTVYMLPQAAMSQDEVDGLGRLFIDSEQREKLEAVRRGTYQAEIEKESRVSNVSVDGLVIRSDGESVIWINGENTLDGNSVKGISVYPGTADKETYKVQVNIDGKRVRLKPGQNWSEGTGTVKDDY